MRTHFLWLAISSSLCGLAGCATVEFRFQTLPDAAVLDEIQPGTTTRSEVLRVLGPPEDMRRPAVFERAQRSSPIERKILAAERVFGDDAYTWGAKVFEAESFGILPIGPPLLRVSWRKTREVRWRIEFDEQDVVTVVSQEDERYDDAHR